MKAKLGDLALLFGGFAKFCGSVVFHAGLEDVEDFGGGLAGGADDEDAAEFFFVAMVGFCKGLFGRVGGGCLALFLG